MAEKKLKISLDLDDKAFQTGIKRAMDQINAMQRDPKHMQAQMQIDQRLRSMGYGGLPGAPGYEQTVASRKKSEQEQKRYIEDLLKSQDKIVKNEQNLTKYKNEQIKAGKDVTGIEKNLANLSEQKLKNEGMIAAVTEKRVRTYRELVSNMEREYKLGGIGGIKQAWGGMSGVEKFGFGATTAGAVIGGLGAAANYMGRRPIDIAQMQGSAMAMTTGRQLREARTGEYTFESMYGNDRQKAKEQAASSRSWGTAGDILKLVGGVLAVGAAIPTGGASLGIGGALLGGAGVAGIASSGLLDPGKWGAKKSQQEAQDFTTMLDALHELDPHRKDAIERLKATGSRDIGMERTLGLNDFGWKTRKGANMGGYYGAGGYLKSQMGLGFTDEQVTGASQGILGAGGSTAMAQMSGTALQAERGLGLTNSTQLLGQLSGTQSIPETSKKSLVDIFARGFDASKYAEENRKYMQAVTEQIYKGGSTSEGTAINVADLIRSAVGNQTPTIRGVEAAKTAFEAFSSASTSTSGFLGGINMSSAMRDPHLSMLTDPAELNSLISRKPNEIDETDPDFVASAKKMNLTGPELAKLLRNRQTNNIRTALNGRTGTSATGAVQNLMPNLDYRSAQGLANIATMPEGPNRDAAIKKAMEDMENKSTGKAGDTAIQASALNAQNSLDTLSDSINKFANDAMEAAKKLRGEQPGPSLSHDAQLAKDRSDLKQYPSDPVLQRRLYNDMTSKEQWQLTHNGK